MSAVVEAKLDDDTGLSYFQTPSLSSGVTVLFIHGLGCSKRWFDVHARDGSYDSLIADVAWLVPDLFGYGESRKAVSGDELSMSAQATRLLRLVRARAADQRLFILAHSMGG